MAQKAEPPGAILFSNRTGAALRSVLEMFGSEITIPAGATVEVQFHNARGAESISFSEDGVTFCCSPDLVRVVDGPHSGEILYSWDKEDRRDPRAAIRSFALSNSLARPLTCKWEPAGPSFQLAPDHIFEFETEAGSPLRAFSWDGTSVNVDARPTFLDDVGPRVGLFYRGKRAWPPPEEGPPLTETHGYAFSGTRVRLEPIGAGASRRFRLQPRMHATLGRFVSGGSPAQPWVEAQFDEDLTKRTSNSAGDRYVALRGKWPVNGFAAGGSAAPLAVKVFVFAKRASGRRPLIEEPDEFVVDASMWW